MRSSSRRLKVTFPGTPAGELAAPPRCSLGSVSPKAMRRLLWLDRNERAVAAAPQGARARWWRHADDRTSEKRTNSEDFFVARRIGSRVRNRFHNEAQLRPLA